MMSVALLFLPALTLHLRLTNITTGGRLKVEQRIFLSQSTHHFSAVGSKFFTCCVRLLIETVIFTQICLVFFLAAVCHFS